MFDVRLETGASVVLRMTTASLRPAMRGALHLNELLRPVGVPLPQVLRADLDATFPTPVLARHPCLPDTRARTPCWHWPWARHVQLGRGPMPKGTRTC